MNEIQEVLDELHTVRPEMLNEKGKKLFEAIMKIADERDLYKNIIKEVREYCLDKAKGRLERTLYDDILEILDKEVNLL